MTVELFPRPKQVECCGSVKTNHRLVIGQNKLQIRLGLDSKIHILATVNKTWEFEDDAMVRVKLGKDRGVKWRKWGRFAGFKGGGEKWQRGRCRGSVGRVLRARGRRPGNIAVGI